MFRFRAGELARAERDLVMFLAVPWQSPIRTRLEESIGMV